MAEKRVAEGIFPIASRCCVGRGLGPSSFFVIFLSVIFLSSPAWSWLKKFARLADSLRHSSTNSGWGFEQEATEKPERDWQNHGWQNHLGIEQQRREDAKRRAERSNQIGT